MMFVFSVLPIFRDAADELIRRSDLSPADLLAKALARIEVGIKVFGTMQQ
jgi:hypothetical protein